MIKRRFLIQTTTRAALGLSFGFATLMMTTSTPWACSKAAYIGSLCVTAGAYCPKGTIEANGQELSPIQYQALYGLYYCNFGGKCPNKFDVPDLRGREMVHYGKGKNLKINAFFGKLRGSETVTHTVATMAPHRHALVPITTEIVEAKITVVAGEASEVDGTATPEAGVTYSLGGVGSDKIESGPYTTELETDTPAYIKGLSIPVLDPHATIGSAGEGKEENNIPPQLGLHICIVTEGVYPPRPE